MNRAAKRWLVTQLCAALASCGAGPRQEVDYSSMETTLGSWPAPMEHRREQSTEPSGSSPDAVDVMKRADSGAQPSEADDGGPAMAPQQDTSDTTHPPGDMQLPSTRDAGAPKPPTRLTFAVLTHVQHPRLSKSDPSFDDDARGPKNMGAIWISKPDGNFVRSLEVWRLHKERARHLVAYNAACACPTPDVTATATLSKHREHTPTWDMTDREGTLVPEGQYTLHVEVSDYDVDKPDKLDPNASNAELSIEFDTRSAPSTLMPNDADFYSGLKLELLEP